MVIAKLMRKNSNIFDTRRVLSVYRATGAVSNHKRVDPLSRINVKTSSAINIKTSATLNIANKHR